MWLTSVPEHRSYDLIALLRGHEVIYFQEFGSYQGEWIMLSMTDDDYHIWKGWYGSCSGCDAYLAAFWEDPEIEEARKFAEEYKPFLVVPRETMCEVVRRGALREIMPANIRDELGGRMMETALADIYTAIKVCEEIDLTPADIMATPNQEIRRSALEQLTPERFYEMANTKVIDKDGDSELLEVGDWRFVYVKDASTPRRYLLRVPPETQTVHEGIAWTFDLSVDEYRPIQET